MKIGERDARRHAEREAIKKSTGKAEARLANVLDRSVRSTERGKVEQAIAQLVKESGFETRSLREELQLYRSLATAGMTSAVFAHEIGRPLDMIDKSISSIQRLLPPEKRREAEIGRKWGGERGG